MLKQRIITALIIAPIAIACVFFLDVSGFSLFVGMVITVSAWEWANLADISGLKRYAYAGFMALLLGIAWFIPPLWVLVLALVWWSVALIFVVQFPGLRHVWGAQVTRLIIGALILVPGFVSLVQLKQSVDSNFLILLLFFLIWGADIAAYFSGRAFGKRKLAPSVSPGKSWAGFWGGMVTALAIAAMMALWLGKPDLTTMRGFAFLAACLAVAVVSVLGDLTISMFKRHRGIKDSSNLLPGHGGFLDRLDSLLAAGPIFALFILVYGWQ
ncbi:MAG: phosphatidate cytidylyltransferase [Gammaproteobacteria bacterium]|mgnify:CR=1 FL=1|jgi:phosphatidate cytidylyltransferase|nr:phosphatidate cytidylyltransferase [Gammaproteobacteria bacterium]|tara:strand:- start:1337 stop:2146 length:810 start_codon:yes stop_codon:yes gene_type:complete